MLLIWCWQILSFVGFSQQDLTRNPCFNFRIKLYITTNFSIERDQQFGPRAKILFEISCLYRSIQLLNNRITACIF